MDGGHALKYVRSRHGSGDGDIARGRRQQEVLTAIAKKLNTLGAFDNAAFFYEGLAKHVTTDISLEMVNYIVPIIKTVGIVEIKKINLSTTNVLKAGSSSDGQAIIMPKEGNFQWGQIQTFIQKQIYED